MLKTELKLGTCLKHKHTSEVYKIAKRKRKSNAKAGWDRYTLHKLIDHDERCETYSYLKFKLIKQYFTIDRTAQVLYSNNV